MKKYITLVIICSFITLVSWCNNSLFVNYTVDNGLVNNTVYYVMQDSKGFIWCCTESGISRFDGKNWDNFTLDEGLADNENFRCYEDSKNRIWFLSSNGKFSYYFQNKIYKVQINKHYKHEEIGMLFDCIEDKKNNKIYFVTSTRKLFFFDSNIEKITEKEMKEDNFILTKYKNEIYSFSSQYPSNNLKATCLSNQKRKSELFKIAPKFMEHFNYYYINNANPILLENNRLIYLTTSGVFQAQNGTIKPYILFKDFPKKSASVMLTKLNNELFVTGANGVFSLSKNDSSRTPKVKPFFSDVLANHIIMDKAGNHWIATHNMGLFFLPKNHTKAKSIFINSSKNQNETYCVFKDKNKKIHIGLLDCSNAIYN